MKKFLRVVPGLLFLLASCEDRGPHPVRESPQPEPPSPTSTPPPVPTSPPSPTPTATPTPVPPPAARLGPEGVLYVVKEISLTTEHGIYRLAAGKTVTIVHTEGDQVTVRDGDREVTATAGHFTRDMNLRDSLLAGRIRQQRAAVDAAKQKRAEFESQQKALHQEAEARELRQHMAARTARANEIRQALRELNTRISNAQAERNKPRGTYYRHSPYHYRDGYYYHHYEKRSRTVRFSTDASQLDTLIQQRDELNRQLRELEGKPGTEGP